MFEFIELLFSPFGTVGRAAWWLIQLGWFVFTVVVYSLIIVLAQVLVQHGKALGPAPTPTGMMIAVVLVMTLLIGCPLAMMWSCLAVTIKRWHDRGKSGFMILLPLVPSLLGVVYGLTQQKPTPLVSLIAVALSLIIDIYILIELGFLPGVDSYYTPQAPRHYSSGAAVRPGGYPARGHAPRPAPPASSGAGTFVLGFCCALFLIGAVGAAYYLGYANVPNLASLRSTLAGFTNSPVTPPSPQAAAPTPAVVPAPTPVTTAPVAPAPIVPPAQTSAPPASHMDDNVLNREHIESDWLIKTYGKDWVIADGERMNGITQVTAAPGMQVTILYSNGGKNLPASSLPQAFLAQWGITPATLAAANQPKTNQ